MSEPYSAFHPLCIVHILYVVLLVQSFLYNGEKTCNLNQPGHSTQQKPIESRLGTYALNPRFLRYFQTQNQKINNIFVDYPYEMQFSEKILMTQYAGS